MDKHDENREPEQQPSTSKKHGSGIHIRETEDDYDKRGKVKVSKSDTSMSSCSRQSNARKSDAGSEGMRLKAQGLKKQRKRKPGKRSGGRVQKRRRKSVRQRRIQRAMSVSTIFTRLSSNSSNRTPGCKYCGHRCCLRRYRSRERRPVRKRAKRRTTRKNRGRRTQPQPPAQASPHNKRNYTASRCLQVGSRSKMLSPLFIDGNEEPKEKSDTESRMDYCEITPEMIYQSLEVLTMWVEGASAGTLCSYLKRNYPVNKNDNALMEELTEKLRVALLLDIVTCDKEDSWMLSHTAQKSRLQSTHVTKFWEIYGDTMKPISKEIVKRPSLSKDTASEKYI